jgi:Pyruvate phosphate dikinase, AMP/ATP-binding domain
MATHAEGITVVRLFDADAEDARLTGAKAANLARAARAGLPVLPWFVLVPDERAGGRGRTRPDALYRAWDDLSRAGTVPLVVRSSSACEDIEWSSMAGRFASVLDVAGWGAFNDAVRIVFGSAGELGAARDMAVLVQPMPDCAAGGVLFGADPVEGRTDRIVISAVRGGPHALVGGTTSGTRYRLTSGGRPLRGEPRQPRADRVLDRGRLRRLARLGRRTLQTFGAPQDVEFGFDAGDRLWLFQSRPITAMAARPPRGGRLLGPGPVAETFPGVLQPVEEDLWLVPMSRGLTTALDIAGAAPRRLLTRLRLVTTVDGLAAADLRLLGSEPPRHRRLALLNPLPGARRLGAAWRVGRLKAALPMLAVDLMADVDAQLADVRPPDELGPEEIAAALSWGRRTLVPLHAQESLAGALLGEETGGTTAAEALSVLAHEQGRGLSETKLLAEHPVLLAPRPAGQGRVDEVRLLLAQTRERGAPRFPWLREYDGAGTDRTFVFVPMLLATGALLSGTAWVLQRIATATAGPRDRRIAGQLAVLGAPVEAATEPGPDLDDIPVLAAGRPHRWRRRVAGAAIMGLCLAALITLLSEFSETQRQDRPEASATAVLLEVSVRGDQTPGWRDLMAHQLWTQCRTSPAVVPDSATLSHVKGDMYAGVVHPALADHDRMRLRGCLVDAQVDRVTFDVVGDGQVGRG